MPLQPAFQLVKRDRVAVLNGLFSLPDPLSKYRIGEDREGLFKALKIVRTHKHSSWPTIARHNETLMLSLNASRNLREMGLLHMKRKSLRHALQKPAGDQALT